MASDNHEDPGAGHRRVEAEVTGQRLVYFAAERTLMAWIRAALGLMALGFVIDRFALVLRTTVLQAGGTWHRTAFSLWAGAALVVAGALMALVAAVRYARFALRYQREGDTEPGHGLGPALFFTVLVSLAGVMIAAFLMTVPS